ncbi:MAG: leucyl aminopeptidase, partial [Jannaschia sp.]
MTRPADVTFAPLDLDGLATAEGVVACMVPEGGTLDTGARRLNRLSKGAVKRAVDSPAFEKLSAGEILEIGFPTGMAATAIALVRLDRRPHRMKALAAGAALAKLRGSRALTLLGGGSKRLTDIVLGAALRGYDFSDHKTGDDTPSVAAIDVRVTKPEEAETAFVAARAQADGVFFTRDLVNEPSNVLTTTEFATRLEALRDHGV